MLNLQRPIVFFDLETTGVSVGHDHIVEICLHKVLPGGDTETRTYRVRPADEQGATIHIPEATTEVHGITDDDVANKPTFKELAPTVLEFIGDADLAGYNSNKFDVPMLVEEFLRAGFTFDVRSRLLVDVQNIFHKMEKRTLKAAYQFYCGKNLDNAHSADADTIATYDVLLAQIERYKDAEYEENGKVCKPIVNDIKALSQFSTMHPTADLVGHIVFNNQHRETFNFGKYKGLTLEEVFGREPSYYDWMMHADFPMSTKIILKEVMDRVRNEQKLQRLKDKFNNH